MFCTCRLNLLLKVSLRKCWLGSLISVFSFAQPVPLVDPIAEARSFLVVRLGSLQRLSVNLSTLLISDSTSALTADRKSRLSFMPRRSRSASRPVSFSMSFFIFRL